MKLRIFFFFLISIIAGRSANAQWKGFSFGPYLEAAWTKGDFAQTHRNGVGIGLSADIKLGGKLAATGSVGYQYFGAKPAPVTVVASTPPVFETVNERSVEEPVALVP